MVVINTNINSQTVIVTIRINFHHGNVTDTWHIASVKLRLR